MTMPRGKFVRIAVAALAGALALGACGGKRNDTGTETSDGGGPQASAGGRLTIATGNTTGVYYQLGGGLARLIDQNLDGYKATASETGASVQNIQGVVGGRYDIAFSLADTANDAVEGKGSFNSPQPVEALTRLYPNYTHVLVRSGAGIDSIADMKGKRISTGSPNSGTEVIAQRLLTAAGLDPAKDVKAQRLGLPETQDGMKDGSIDGMFWSGGLPTGGITDLTTSLRDKVKFLDLSKELPGLQEEYGKIYEAGNLPADTYSQAKDIPTIVVPNVLVVKKGFDPDLAGELVKLIFDKRADLEKVNPAAEDISLDTAKQTEPIPLNAGAAKALDTLGAK
ncbi:TAXI family TRAP transporter solute-binding subunit [Actinopolymorpha pittospori]|uniref:TRAP transporter TAXI family solute receptor n=1 Tax=Actinopolymorpha pittospori TaxID=648752 RepID=A0A927RR52_9ACTN|nr:TAXI family TRAP transporter solute-binding subunit [Actinopolymorpha pittospori]MBE1612963.1 TRAP transporter TAXI family solute receptor [Actinopolymorpha pittospori]